MNWELKADERIRFSISYADILGNIQSIGNISKTNRVFIVVDHNVYRYYRTQFDDLVKQSDKTISILVLEIHEQTKNVEFALKVIQFMDDNLLLRKAEPLVAIGGGVLLDVAAFACSVYRRGVPIVKIPTTLLSMVDASVGIKTGINYGTKRNRIGSYYPPKKVYIDKRFLNTLPMRHISNGVGEILKIGIVKSNHLIQCLERYAPHKRERFSSGELASHIIDRSIDLMLEELEPNLWEKNLKRCVDFGHSFSPLVELTHDSLLHGEAVTLDCLLSSCIAVNKNLMPKSDLMKIYDLCKSYDLPTQHEGFENVPLLEKSIAEAVAHRNGDYNLPMPNPLGKHIFINQLNKEDIASGVALLKALASK
jgi:3-dehydroquinate synthase